MTVFCLILSCRPGQRSMTALTSHGCRVMEGDFTFDWTGGGMLLEQPLMRLCVWWCLGNPGQQRPAAQHASPQFIPQWFLGHAHGWGKQRSVEVSTNYFQTSTAWLVCTAGLLFTDLPGTTYRNTILRLSAIMQNVCYNTSKCLLVSYPAIRSWSFCLEFARWE